MIVVLDGYTLNPGDLSWDRLKALGPCTFYDRVAESEVVERSRNAQVILTNKVSITGDHIRALPGLRYIGVTATGYNIVDVKAAAQHQLVVTKVPPHGTRSVVP